MKRPGQILRLFYINFVIARRGLDRVVLHTPTFWPFRFLSYLNPWNWFKSQQKNRGQAIRLALEDLGPIFVKFGQILSTRHDLLPEDIISELQKLQDNVPPFPTDQVWQIIEQTYGQPWSAVFAEFSVLPLASASIAQVHTAITHNGERVVVKIRRPQIEKVIRRDLSLLYTVAALTERFWSHGKRLRPRELVSEFERTIIDEQNFLCEAANASQLRRNFLHSPLLYVPEIYWEYTRKNIIVMEQVNGIAIADRASLLAAGIDLQKLAERGVEIFFTQVFRDSFFHADMHPGNIFVAKDQLEDPQYIAVDFGIMGALSPKDQHYLAENLLAFFKRDYRRVAVLHVESGWVPPFIRVEEFEAAIRCVCEPIFEKPLADISFAQLLLSLFQTASRFKMEIQPQLLLLQKTLFNIEGLGRRLYPQLDLWATGKPFLERWIKQRYSPKKLLHNLAQQGPMAMERLAALPVLWYETLEHERKKQLFEAWQSQAGPDKKRNKTAAKYFLLGAGLGLLVAAIMLATQGMNLGAWWKILGGMGILLFVAGLISN